MSKLPNGWIETTLGEVVTFQRGFDLPKKDRIHGKYPLMVSNGQEGTHKIYKVKAPGVITGRSGTLGSVFYIEENFWPLNTTLWIKDFHGNNAKFVYYYLKTFPFDKYNAGSGVPTLNRNHIHPISIVVPPLPEQKAIADVLSSLDEKIELLQEENKTLEELAQTMFKEWFVNFNYPGATGEMEDSELGEIPKGWRVIELRKIVDTINGYAYKGKELVEESLEALVTLKSFNRNGGFQTRGFKPFSGNPKQKQEVQLSDLIVSHTDLTQDAEVIGNPAFIFENGGFKKMYITMDLVKVVSKEEKIDNSFLYYLMKRREFKEHCVGYSNGTTVLHLSKLAIPEYKLGLPQDFDLIETFSSIIKPSIEKIMNNINQVQTLSETRDLLLPKLMSGEIRVEGFGE